MTKIICRASDCIFWEDGACSSDEITYDPENGCLTYEGLEDILLEDEEDWEDEDILNDSSLSWGDEEDDLLDLDEDEIEDEWVI
jgi:hypothetical protein